MANRLFTDDEQEGVRKALRDLKAAVLAEIEPLLRPVLDALARFLRRFYPDD
jgi:hypothetical protein